MYPTPVPWTVLSSTVGVGILTADWNLADAPTSTEESRTFKVPVEFATAFQSIPVVHLGLSGFDTDNRQSARMTLSVSEVTTTGFIAQISSWSGSCIYAVEFNWLAIGA